MMWDKAFARGLTSAGLTRTAARGWLTVFAGLAITQGGAALAQIILARRVAAEDYGRYLAAVGLVTVLAALANLGLDQWLLASPTGTSEGISKRYYSALRLRLPLLGVWLLALAALSLTLPAATFPQTYVILAGLSVGAEGVALLAFSALRTRGRHIDVTAMQSAGALVTLLAAVALPLLPGRAGWFLAGRATISLALALAAFVQTRARLGRAVDALEPRRAVAITALPFMTSELAVAIYMRADLAILSMVKGIEGASIYGPATSMLSMCFLIPNALYLLALPPMARRFAQSQPSYARLSRAQLIAQAISGLLLFVAVIFFAPALIRITLGPGYAASAETLRLLSPILLVKSISFGFGAMLTSEGRQRARTRTQIAVAVLNMAANLLIVGRFGVTGVAVVYVVSEALLWGGYLLALKRSRSMP